MSETNLHAIRKRLAEWLGWPYAYDQWRPDERIEQAWMLLEKAREDYSLYIDGDSQGWACLMQKAGVGDTVSHEAAPTAPLAIALAVYAAVGGGE